MAIDRRYIGREYLERNCARVPQSAKVGPVASDDRLERDIGVKTALRQRHFSVQQCRRICPRLIGGHIKDGRDASGGCRLGSGLEILLVGQSRFAEMGVSIDQARQQGAACDVEIGL